MDQYRQLIQSPYKIPCANQLDQVNSVVKTAMLDKVLFQRLTHKNNLANQLLLNNQGDWEAITYQLLAYNFGFKVNSSAFLDLSLNLPSKIITKNAAHLVQLEALLLGQAGLLAKNHNKADRYWVRLVKEHGYLCHKYQLATGTISPTSEVLSIKAF